MLHFHATEQTGESLSRQQSNSKQYQHLVTGKGDLAMGRKEGPAKPISLKESATH